MLSLYTSGRDATNFPDPEKFWPERWLREPSGAYKSVISPHASMPFAMGARSCIGKKLAEVQMMVTVASVSNFSFFFAYLDPFLMLVQSSTCDSNYLKNFRSYNSLK